ncbi:MAG: maltose ABC transporter permease MalF [Candidatus Bipolaricaulota bacterium]|nr:MAG: maltose ABC transporter permease MalF [Candidatus Bipolaricaulota bacterium]
MKRPGLASTLVKIVLLCLLDAVAVWGVIILGSRGSYALLGFLAVGTLLLNFVSLSKRAYPLRYLLPGLIFLFGMVVYPIVYTVYISTTNTQTGHILTKDQVVTQLESRTYQPPDGLHFASTVFQDEDGQLVVILSDDAGAMLVAEELEFLPLAADDPRLERDGEGRIVAVGDHVLLEGLAVFSVLSELETRRYTYGTTYLQLSGIEEFREVVPLYAFDEGRNVLVDLRSGVEYTPVEGTFTAPDGSVVEPGFRVNVGARNYTDILSDEGIRSDFVRVFTWTIIWALLSVVFSFALGLGLAMLLNDPYIRGRFFYRSVLIVPYAIPAFISALVWLGLFNTEAGAINRILQDLFGAAGKVPWLQDPIWAKAMLIFVNTWLTFPYMMIISLGALQSIPGGIYEAARIDGANGFQRLTRITLPLLLVSTAPLLIGSFAFTFNNFTVVFLMTGGRPPVLGAATPAGATDILISWTYRIAFQGVRGNQLALASAIAVIIFVIIATISAINFRFTKALEEVHRGV